MNCPCKAFKRKVYLFILAILASLLSFPHAYAMEGEDSYSETEIEAQTPEGEFSASDLQNNSLKRKEDPSGEESAATMSAITHNPAKKLRDNSALTTSLATYTPPLIQTLSEENGTAHSSFQGHHPTSLGNGNNFRAFKPYSLTGNGNASEPHSSVHALPAPTSVLHTQLCMPLPNGSMGPRPYGSATRGQNNKAKAMPTGHLASWKEVEQQGQRHCQLLESPQQLPTVTLEHVELLIAANTPEARDELMDILSRGLYGTTITPERTGFLHWPDIQKRCYEKDSYALFVLSHGEKIGKDFPELFTAIKGRAEQNIPAAQCNLGKLYEIGCMEGGESEANDKMAVSWYQKAAGQNVAYAHYALGWMYKEGRGVGGKSEANDKFALG